MEDKWKRLEQLRIKFSPEKAKSKTDRKYMEDLEAKREDGQWKNFYRAIQALEKGCGYSENKKVEILIKECVEQDRFRLLQIIEDKEMFEIVMLLRYVDDEIKFMWLKGKSFSSVSVLFECLRQVMKSDISVSVNQDAIVCGLCELSELSTEHFRYFLQRFLLYRNKTVFIMEKLLGKLSINGWRILSNSISFSDVAAEKRLFWDTCGRDLDWSEICNRAYPFIDSWEMYIEECVEKGTSTGALYNALSNYLGKILLYQIKDFHDYTEKFQRAVVLSERAMLRWYGNIVQQRSAILACLAQIELLHIIWISRQEGYAESFPEDLRKRALAFMLQSRFLWDKEKCTISEIQELKRWLENVNVAIVE